MSPPAPRHPPHQGHKSVDSLVRASHSDGLRLLFACSGDKLIPHFRNCAMAAWLAVFPAQALAAPEVRISDSVILVPDPQARSVTFWLIVHAGCADEAGGQCLGISHYLEHLLFLGRSTDHPEKSIAFFRDGAGNGSTTYQSTSYWQRFPARPGGQSEDLEKLFRFYTERLQGFEVGEAEAERERNIVLQEYNWRIASSADARFYVKLNRAMLPDDPQGQNIAGSPEIISGYSVAAARAFHQSWYARNNATIVVHGPVDEALVKALADRYVAPLPFKKLPDRAWRQTLRSYEEAALDVRVSDAEARGVDMVTEKMVRIEESDRARMGAARLVLSSFLSGRFDGAPHDVLVEQGGLTSGIDYIGVSSVGPGALRASFSAKPAAGVTPEKLGGAFWSYIGALARTGLPQGMVERLKKRIAEDRVIAAREPERVMGGLTQWLTGGQSYADYQARTEALASVTDADVTAILKAFAGPGRRVNGVLSPPS